MRKNELIGLAIIIAIFAGLGWSISYQANRESEKFKVCQAKCLPHAVYQREPCICDMTKELR